MTGSQKEVRMINDGEDGNGLQCMGKLEKGGRNPS